MKTTNILFYISLIFIPFGYIFRILEIKGGSMIMLTGLIGIFIYYFAKIIKQIVNKQYDLLILLLESLIVIITPIFFSKYFYYFFGNYVGLIVIPFFILSAIFYLIKHKEKHLKLTLISTLYLLMTIPLFGLDYYKKPVEYIPISWYDRYNVVECRKFSLPNSFKYYKTKELSIKAFKLKQVKEYHYAILLYRKAISIEPENPILYFDISECYSRINELESAINVLDTAILLDGDIPAFYNNRGLLYYKLKENQKSIQDFEIAIKLDSTEYSFYLNSALVYKNEKEYDKANKMLDKAEELGQDISRNSIFRTIRNKKK